MPIIEYENGMTVSELKKLIADWPETDDEGTPCEVWVGNNLGFSSAAKIALLS